MITTDNETVLTGSVGRSDVDGWVGFWDFDFGGGDLKFFVCHS